MCGGGTSPGVVLAASAVAAATSSDAGTGGVAPVPATALEDCDSFAGRSTTGMEAAVGASALAVIAVVDWASGMLWCVCLCKITDSSDPEPPEKR